MQIKPKNYYHGAALIQIVEDPSFTALNKADSKYGHYFINQDIRLLVKHATNNTSPWGFTLQSDDIDIITSDIKQGFRTFVCLVCGLRTVCPLTIEQLKQVVKMPCEKSQNITISCPGKKNQLKVKGPEGEVKGKIPHNSFPSVIFSKQLQTIK